MDWLKKIVLVLAVCVILSIAGVLGYLSIYGRAVFIEQAGSLTKRKVTIGAVRPALPLGLRLEDVTIEGLLFSRRARLNVDPLALLAGRLAFSSAGIDDATLYLERGSDASLKAQPSAPLAQAAQAKAGAAAVQSAGKPSTVILKTLNITNGALVVRDEKSGKEWVVDKIHGDVQNIPLANTPARTEVSLTGSLGRLDVPFVGHFLKVKGWLNWAGRDMEMSAQAVDDNGRAGLDVVLSSRANDLAVQGKVKISGSQQKQASGKHSGSIESAVLGVLDALTTNIDAAFSFHTRMDHFDVGQISLAGNVTTDLQTGLPSGNIATGLKAVGDELLKANASQEQVK